MSIGQQIDRLKILHAQIEQASKEGLILVMVDISIDFQKWENSSYYLKKLAKAYQLMIGKCGSELINFGITWNRIHKDGNVLMSSIDHGLTLFLLGGHFWPHQPKAV